MYKHILVAVGSDSDFNTLKSAINLSRDCGARLTALHVVDTVPHLTLMADLDISAALSAFETHGRSMIEQCNRAFEEAACDGEAQMWTAPLCSATIGRVIANAASELGADLIMLGSSSPSWLRFYAPNVQKDVTRYSAVPVLVMTPSCTMPTKPAAFAAA
ncbi:MAG: universal stress protein [Paraburkholderia sp.]|uniref:universal stress protein n=1 Tax=Paraburkholderia sp. TaxID=1926495 RepID=UPI003C4BF5A8